MGSSFPTGFLRQEGRERFGAGRKATPQQYQQLISTRYLSRLLTSASFPRFSTLWARAMTLKPWLVYVLSSFKKLAGTVYRKKFYG